MSTSRIKLIESEVRKQLKYYKLPITEKSVKTIANNIHDTGIDVTTYFRQMILHGKGKKK